MNNTTNNVPSFSGNRRSGSDQYDARFPSYNSVQNRPSLASQPFRYRRERAETSSAGTGDTGSAANNLSLVPGNQRSGSSSYVHFPNRNVGNRSSRTPPRPNRPFDISGGEPDSWRLFEDRVRTGPYSLNRFPSHPFSPMRVIFLNGEMAREVSPMLRQFIQQSPPRIRNQWQTQTAPQEDESRLTKEEQEKALKKLKKQVYLPKTRSRRWSIYFRENVSGEKDEETDEDGKRCAICLEDFFASEDVLVTPCNHMFHEECIIPWVKGNGQCPVCRFAIGERRTQSQSNINANLTADDHAAVDFIPLIRAMEEAVEWLHILR